VTIIRSIEACVINRIPDARRAIAVSALVLIFQLAANGCRDTDDPNDLTPMNAPTPAVSDTSATAVEFEGCPKSMIGPIMIMPCCTSDNHCGADGSAVGMGCQDLASPTFRMLATNPPPPQTCDGEPLSDVSVPGGSVPVAGSGAVGPAVPATGNVGQNMGVPPTAAAGVSGAPATGTAAGGSIAPATAATGAAGASVAGAAAGGSAGPATGATAGACPSGFICDANPVGDPPMVCKVSGSQIPPMCTTAEDCADLGTTCSEVASGFSLCVLACN
jgi:hypothetical protein